MRNRDAPCPPPHGPGRPGPPSVLPPGPLLSSSFSSSSFSSSSLLLFFFLLLLWPLLANAIPTVSDNNDADDAVLNPDVSSANDDVFDDIDYFDLGHPDPTLMCTDELVRAKEKQCFKRVPEKSVYAPLHSSIVLPCQVENKRGKMQWYKQGLGVFGSGDQPYAYDKYAYTGDQKIGEKHLLIRNVTMDLEGKYECQVQPVPNLLRYKTNIVVLVKPGPPEMEVNGQTARDSDKVHIRSESLQQQFRCSALGGNPAPRFQWYKSGHSIRTTPASKAPVKNPLKFRHEDRLTLMTSSLQGGETVTCSVSNEATRLSENGRKSLSVSVITVKQRAPGRPVIEPETRRHRYYEGDRFAAVCRARVGVPAGSLLWRQHMADPQRDDHRFFRYRIDKQFLVNRLQLSNLNRGDHNSKLTCEAANEMTRDGLKASIKVVVHFAPLRVRIQSNPPSEKTQLMPNGDRVLVVYGSVGQTKELTCITDHYYPTASIFWRKGKQRVTSQKERVITEAQGNRLQSNVSITFTKGDHGVDLVCVASGIKSQRVTTRVKLNIMYPPGRPYIVGPRKRPIRRANGRAGEKMTLQCISKGGNPPPSLFWYRNNGLQPIEGEKERPDDGKMIKDLTFVPTRRDNGDKVICKSSNAVAGSTEMLSSAPVTMDVSFAPERITISMDGHQTASEGQRLSFVCKSSASNPGATVTWKKINCRRNHKCISQRLEVSKVLNQPGAYDGVETHSYVEFLVSWEDDGQLVECTAANPKFPSMPVRDRLRLNITYSPKFAPGMDRPRMFLEGQSDEVDLSPLANPSIRRHKWLRNIHPFSGNDRISLSQTKMTLRSVNRADMANYTLVVHNGLGETRVSFFLNVTYPPRLVSLSKTNVTARPAKPVELRCRFEANPAPLAGIVWRRLNPATKEVLSEASCAGPLDSTRLARRMRVRCKRASKKHRVSTAMVIAPTEGGDTGVYQCALRNGAGRPASRNFEVLVPSGPYIKMNPLRSKAAADVGGSVNLNCEAFGEPWLTFTWFRGQDNLTLATGKTYRMSTRRLYPGHYRGTLQVSNVKSGDFGVYFCQASNRLGADVVQVRLLRSRAPDMPLQLRVINVTETSVTLAWEPGFNGGYGQTFQLRYRELEPGERLNANDDGRGNYQYADTKAIPGAETMQYTVTGLLSGTEYVFSMNSRNDRKGAGRRTPPVRMKTKDSLRGDTPIRSGTKGTPSRRDDTSILIIVAACIFGGLIILVNILVITCILRRKGRCQGTHEQEYMKADTVELYQHHQPPSITGSSQQGAESVTVSEALLHNYREMHPLAHGVQAEYFEPGLYPGLPPRLAASVPNTSPVPNSLPPPSPAQSAVLPSHTYVNVDNIMHCSFPRDQNMYNQYTRNVTLPRDAYLEDAKRVHFSDSLRQRMTTSGIFASPPRCAPPDPPQRTVSNQLSVSQLVIPPPQDFSPPESACESVIERPAASTSSPLRANHHQNHNPMTNSITTFAAISTDPDDEGYTSVV